jgi:hypothetical protein
MNYQFRSRLFGKIQPCLQPKMSHEHLVLLGDCFPLYGSNYEESIKLRNFVSTTWPKVYVVPGLVELCGNGLRSHVRNIDQLHEVMDQAPKSNITVLNNTEIHDGDSMLVGSTFWSAAGPASEIIKQQPQLATKNIDQWITDDADFIGTMIKNATIMKKDITVATYFPINNLNLDGMLIFAKHLDHIALETLKGRWISGLIGRD